MQANVNLDALLEKMKAELERIKSPVDVEKILKCAEAIKPLVEERDCGMIIGSTRSTKNIVVLVGQ
ncbi:hypothetical protein E3E26_00430 [Thermococcus sp. LS1]|uniref:hypothetical protein n=1 Tax=Thermococcus sp. LS1 TaxID=1638259 RepID=UPI00143C1260|nr:hypothetical protein [Thermococcus sp. LS1]NJD98274.1 hypothetical protein [Thermococcus sp. LS1]